MARGASLYIKTEGDTPAAKGRPFHASILRQVISLPLFGKDHHHHPDSGGGAGVARGRGGGPGAAARPGRGGRERPALQAALPGYSWHHFPEQKLQGGERGASAGSAPPVTSPGPPARRRGASGAGGSGAVSCELLWRSEGPRAEGDQVRWDLGSAGPRGKRDLGLGRGPPPHPDQTLGGSAGGSLSRFPPLCSGQRPRFGPEEAGDWLFGC